MGALYPGALSLARPPLSTSLIEGVYTVTPGEPRKCLPAPINPSPETKPEPLRQTETSG